MWIKVTHPNPSMAYRGLAAALSLGIFRSRDNPRKSRHFCFCQFVVVGFIMISRRSLEVGILLSLALVAICWAGMTERNQTLDSTPEGIAASIPFPGSGWIDRMATPNNKFTLESTGETYSSAYDAILYGKPLQIPCRNFNAWVNSFFFGNDMTASLIHMVGIEWAHYILCYLRNFVGAMLVYYGTGGIFHYFCYVHPMSQKIFQDRTRPSWETIWNQIQLSQKSMFIYVLLPVLDEFLIESGWTRTYYTIDEIGGWPMYMGTMILYFSLVEIGIYWMHRTLHTNKWMYKNIHMMHHQYKKAETLTPWASIAFNPIDGMLQASPYVGALFFVPCHYMTHFGLLFFTAIWATYIHDSMDWNIDPIMGSKYHTVHHTHYIYNYGQVFTFCDRIWGTFREPEGPTGVPVKRKAL